MDFEEFMTVYTVSNPVKAEIIKNFLQSESIPCFLDGVNQAAEAGLMRSKSKCKSPPLMPSGACLDRGT